MKRTRQGPAIRRLIMSRVRQLARWRQTRPHSRAPNPGSAVDGGRGVGAPSRLLSHGPRVASRLRRAQERMSHGPTASRGAGRADLRRARGSDAGRSRGPSVHRVRRPRPAPCVCGCPWSRLGGPRGADAGRWAGARHDPDHAADADPGRGRGPGFPERDRWARARVPRGPRGGSVRRRALRVSQSARHRRSNVWCTTRQGFWLAQKRLSRGRFRWWPAAGTGAAPLAAHQLQRLIMAGDPAARDAAPVWRPVRTG